MGIHTSIESNSFDEQLFYARKYFFESGGNTEHLSTLLVRVDIDLTNGTREFIASVLNGKAKKNGKLRKKYFWHLNIYWSINDLLSEGVLLTSNKDEAGAVCQVAESYRITEDAALKIYQRMTPKLNLDDYI